jgi:hypothetical protein
VLRVRGCRVGAVLLTGFMAVTVHGESGGADPFAWLAPAVRLEGETRDRLARGEAVVRVLPSENGELAVFAATPTTAQPDVVASWFGAIGELKRSEFVLGIRRMSEPPTLQDLSGLALDDGDLESLRGCQPGNCEVKLSREDILALRQASTVPGPAWKEAVQTVFRERLLALVNAYRADGLQALPPYADRRSPVSPHEAFARLLTRSPYVTSLLLSNHLERVDTFFYWSKEQYGAGKAVVSLTHVDVFRSSLTSGPGVLVVSAELFATHYRSASLGVTALTPDGRGRTYLTYVNRSTLDVLGGMFGGLKRSVLERRLAGESLKTFGVLRSRLESGPPPTPRTNVAP